MSKESEIKIYCPVCGNHSFLEDDDGDEVYCEVCGCVVYTAYPYVAGRRIRLRI